MGGEEEMRKYIVVLKENNVTHFFTKTAVVPEDTIVKAKNIKEAEEILFKRFKLKVLPYR